jgi:hypothetical protein
MGVIIIIISSSRIYFIFLMMMIKKVENLHTVFATFIPGGVNGMHHFFKEF